MLSIVGNIKIENDHRLTYLMATLRSFEFLKDNCELLLNVDCSQELFDLIQLEIHSIGFTAMLTNKSGNYGKLYLELLKQANTNYILNFFEDHFTVLDSIEQLEQILLAMIVHAVDVCKCSFFEIEQNSVANVFCNNTVSGFIYDNTRVNHGSYQMHYGERYYIGTNFLTTKEFALKFWNREFNSTRPHSWEIARYDPSFEHRVLIPNVPFMASIEDDHGQEGTCLLKTPTKKFTDIMNLIYQKERV